MEQQAGAGAGRARRGGSHCVWPPAGERSSTTLPNLCHFPSRQDRGGWIKEKPLSSKPVESFAVFEFETLLAFGVGASLVALAPLVRRYGNPQVGDSMSDTGRSLAKRGIKMGVAVAGVATTAAQAVARGAAEAAESFHDLVAEARAEMNASPGETAEDSDEAPATATEVSLD
jgi:hypothetical protein